MEGGAPAGVSPYVNVPLPAAVFNQFKGKTVFKEVDLVPYKDQKGATASKGGKEATFNFGKALSGIKADKGSAVTSKGDGSFDDGTRIKTIDDPSKNVKYVQLSPSALDPSNAEETLKLLDQLQSGGRRPPAPPPPSKANTETPDVAGLSRLFEDSGLQRLANQAGKADTSNRSALEAASAALYDLSDSAAPPSSSSGAGATSTFSFTQLQEPQHTITLLPPADAAGVDSQGQGQGQGQGCGSSSSSSRCGRVQVEVIMPDVESAAEADVKVGGSMLKLTVPGKYRLAVQLPVKVNDDASSAKWSKAKRKLTLMLVQQPSQ